MTDWQTVQVPHRARRSFDYATCVCGWHATDDDPNILNILVRMHNEYLADHLVTVEEHEVLMTESTQVKHRFAVDELPGFLTERVAEEVEVARAAEHADGPATLEWRSGGPRHLRFDNGRREGYESVFAGSWDRILVARDDGTVSTHIALWDPSHVLAELAAKSLIVKRHARVRFGPTRCHCCWTHPYDRPVFPCTTLKALAIPYADHCDFRDEWRLTDEELP